MKRKPSTIVLLLLLAISTPLWADSVVIVNETSRTLYEIYLAPTEGRTWGNDVLGDSVLPAGEEIQVSIKAAGRYDTMAIDEVQRQYYVTSELMNDGKHVRITDADRREGQALPQDVGYGWIRVRNETGFTVHYIYVSPGYASSWEEGEQVLPSDVILPNGEEYLIEVDISAYRTSVFDFLLIDEDRDRYAKWDVDLSETVVLPVTLQDIQWE